MSINQVNYPYLKKSMLYGTGKLRPFQSVCFYHEPWDTDVVINVMTVQFYPTMLPTITVLPRIFPISPSVGVLNKDKGSYEFSTSQQEQEILDLYRNQAIDLVCREMEVCLKKGFTAHEIKDIRLQYLVGIQENIIRNVTVVNPVNSVEFAFHLGVLVRDKQLSNRVLIVQEIGRYGSEVLKSAYLQGLHSYA